MVDSISYNVFRGLRVPSGPDPKGETTPRAPAASGNPLNSADVVELGSTTAKALVDKGPPFNLETVSKIKKAIEDGNYPIDIDRITESLFQGHDDLLLR